MAEPPASAPVGTSTTPQNNLRCSPTLWSEFQQLLPPSSTLTNTSSSSQTTPGWSPPLSPELFVAQFSSEPEVPQDLSIDPRQACGHSTSMFFESKVPSIPHFFLGCFLERFGDYPAIFCKQCLLTVVCCAQWVFAHWNSRFMPQGQNQSAWWNNPGRKRVDEIIKSSGCRQFCQKYAKICRLHLDLVRPSNCLRPGCWHAFPGGFNCWCVQVNRYGIVTTQIHDESHSSHRSHKKRSTIFSSSSSPRYPLCWNAPSKPVFSLSPASCQIHQQLQTELARTSPGGAAVFTPGTQVMFGPDMQAPLVTFVNETFALVWTPRSETACQVPVSLKYPNYDELFDTQTIFQYTDLREPPQCTIANQAQTPFSPNAAGDSQCTTALDA